MNAWIKTKLVMKKGMDLKYILWTEHFGFVDGLDVWYKRKREVKDDS